MKRYETYRVAVVDDSPHTGIDDRFQQWPRVPHPIASSRKVHVYPVVAHLPVRLSTNLVHERTVAEVAVKRGRVWIRVQTEDIVRVVRS